MPKTHVNITGYWHAVEVADGAEDGVGAPDAPAAVDLDALLSPVPWFAARTALAIGLLDAIAVAPRSVSELAASLGVDRGGLRVLVQALATFDAVVCDDGLVALGAAGDAILEDEHLREGLDDTEEGALLLSLAHLATALRSGTPSHVLAHGATPSDTAEGDPSRAREIVEGAIGFDFVARGIADLPTLAGAGSVAVTGPGSVAFSDALSGGAAVTVVGSLLELDAARIAQPASTFVAADGFGSVGADVVATALALARRTDTEVVTLLSSLGEFADAAVVVELLLPELTAPTDHDAEHALLAYAATGAAPRTVADLERLAAAAGWRLVRSTPLGWDHEALELRRVS
jgi:hypothetical protein